MDFSDALSAGAKGILKQLVRQPENEKLLWKYQNSLRFLCKCFSRVYNRRTVILIDDYDSPFIAAGRHGYLAEAATFLQPFFSCALKGNDDLQFGVLTGWLPVTELGLNNVDAYSVLRPKFADAFGFTQEEVQQVMAERGRSAEVDAVQDFYAGYQAGREKLCRPGSICSYLDKRQLGRYWAETSAPDALIEAVQRHSAQEKEMLRKLADGGTIYAVIPPAVSADPAKLNLGKLLLYAGYLTAAEQDDSSAFNHVHTLKIPNAEIREVIRTALAAAGD